MGKGWLTISQSQTDCSGGDSEMKEERQGLQEDRHMQKGLNMFVTESSAGRMTSASCGTMIGVGLGVIGRLGVQRRQTLLGIPLDTFHGIQEGEHL